MSQRWNPMVGAQGDRPWELHHSVLGFRGWKVHRPADGSPIRLRSDLMAVVWNQPTMTAECLQQDGADKYSHKAPFNDCSCGYYGYYDPFSEYRHGPILGAIAASGKTQVHSHGFRAEKVTIIALALPLEIADMPAEEMEAREQEVREIAAFYRVPVVEPAELESFASEFATQVPKELRPEPKPRPTQQPQIAVIDHSQLVKMGAGVAGFTVGLALLGYRLVIRRGA